MSSVRVRDELIEIAAFLEQKRRLREERIKTKPTCPYCGEKVGQCKMRRP